jgi:hypothetical protein
LAIAPAQDDSSVYDLLGLRSFWPKLFFRPKIFLPKISRPVIFPACAALAL